MFDVALDGKAIKCSSHMYSKRKITSLALFKMIMMTINSSKVPLSVLKLEGKQEEKNGSYDVYFDQMKNVHSLFFVYLNEKMHVFLVLLVYTCLPTAHNYSDKDSKDKEVNKMGRTESLTAAAAPSDDNEDPRKMCVYLFTNSCRSYVYFPSERKREV